MEYPDERFLHQAGVYGSETGRRYGLLFQRMPGNRTETDVSEMMLEKLPLFIDMTIIEFVTD
jgi:hypothetical protein